MMHHFIWVLRNKFIRTIWNGWKGNKIKIKVNDDAWIVIKIFWWNVLSWFGNVRTTSKGNQVGKKWPIILGRILIQKHWRYWTKNSLNCYPSFVFLTDNQRTYSVRYWLLYLKYVVLSFRALCFSVIMIVFVVMLISSFVSFCGRRLTWESLEYRKQKDKSWDHNVEVKMFLFERTFSTWIDFLSQG